MFVPAWRNTPQGIHADVTATPVGGVGLEVLGYDIGQLVKIVDKALQARKLRKTREQIARELAELEAAGKKPPAAEAK